MAIKINFTGAQGTGKTTILKALQEDPDFSGFEFVTEVVRNYIKGLGIKINADGTVETQKLLFKAYSELLNKENSFISDRCVIDVCAYTLSGWARTRTKKEAIEFNEVLLHQTLFVEKYKESIGTVFYFPIEFPIEDDSVRSIDVKYQREIDSNILQVLKEAGIPYVTVHGTIEERIKIIKETLSEISR